MNGWVGHVGWPTVDGLSIQMVTHQLQVRCRPVKVRQSETDDRRSATEPPNQHWCMMQIVVVVVAAAAAAAAAAWLWCMMHTGQMMHTQMHWLHCGKKSLYRKCWRMPSPWNMSPSSRSTTFATTSTRRWQTSIRCLASRFVCRAVHFDCVMLQMLNCSVSISIQWWWWWCDIILIAIVKTFFSVEIEPKLHRSSGCLSQWLAASVQPQNSASDTLMEWIFTSILFLHRRPFSCLIRTWWDSVKEHREGDWVKGKTG